MIIEVLRQCDNANSSDAVQLADPSDRPATGGTTHVPPTRLDLTRCDSTSSRLDSTQLGSQAIPTMHTKQGRTEAPLWVYPTFIQSSLCSFSAIFANLFSYINLTRSVGQSSLLWWKLQCQV